MVSARSVFDVVDAMDLNAVAALFAEDATMVFANGEPMVGREAVVAGNTAFMSTIKGLRHRLLNEWRVGATTIAETEVTYSRVDGKDVSLPAVSIWSTREDGLIVDYRVFVDLAPVHAA
jgi:ketosteroid isomerase-like protein